MTFLHTPEVARKLLAIMLWCFSYSLTQSFVQFFFCVLREKKKVKDNIILAFWPLSSLIESKRKTLQWFVSKDERPEVIFDRFFFFFSFSARRLSIVYYCGRKVNFFFFAEEVSYHLISYTVELFRSTFRWVYCFDVKKKSLINANVMITAMNQHFFFSVKK
jgi:hypothetical protein